MKMWRVLGLALLGSLCGMSGLARADLVLYGFIGTDSANNATVTGTLTYNTPGTFTTTSNNNGTQLNNFTTNGSLSFTEGSSSWTSGPTTLNVSLGGSSISFAGTGNGGTPALGLEITQSSGSAPLFSDITALPGTLSLTNAVGSFSISTFDSNPVNILGTFTQLFAPVIDPAPPRAVPEPGSLALAGAGLVTLLAALRKRRSRCPLPS